MTNEDQSKSAQRAQGKQITRRSYEKGKDDKNSTGVPCRLKLKA